MLNKTFIKRRYFDFRSGNSILSPIVQFGNFLMLAYLTISEIIPIYIFAPLFVLAVLMSFTLVGSGFRKVQVSTDLNMIYEKSTESAETLYQMMLAQRWIMVSCGIIIPRSFDERMYHMKKISEGRI